MTDKQRRQLETLSVEQLKSILQAELVSEETNIELIKCVNTILDEKEGAIEFDVDAAWGEFVQEHIGSETLYTMEDEDVQSSKTEHTQQMRSRSLVRRILPIAATIAIFMGSLVTAQALGVNIFGMMARLTSEIFFFSDSSIPYAVVQTNPLVEGETRSYDTLQDAVDAFGIKEALVPTMLPERFAFPEVTATNLEGRVSIRAVYRVNGSYLRISFSEVVAKEHGVTETNINEAIDVFLSGLHHYITADDNRMKAVWRNGELECHIAGDITEQELTDALKSIYEDIANEKHQE